MCSKNKVIMDNTKHSPLPFKSYAELNIVNSKNEFIASCGVNGRDPQTSKDNVQFIVTACNNHYKLLEACKKIESMELVDKVKVEYGDLMMLISAMKATARLAIAKTEGK